MVGWVKDKRKKRKTRNSTAPVYNNTNMSNSTNTTHGGPGAIVSYKEGLRFATNTTFSTNFFYHARSIPSTYTDGERNKSRQVGEGQPLYMNMDLGFSSSLGIEAPALPLTINAGNTLDNMEGMCFLIEWPGHRMHEDPDTANAAKTGVYARWLELTTVLSQTQNIQFADVMLNPQWKKLIVTNTFLRFEFFNTSIYDYRIHIITYTNKRKGLKYSQEFVQWINGIDSDTDGDKLVAYDFYVNGKFTLPPPCKVLTHKTFMIKSAMTDKSRHWSPFDGVQWYHGNHAITGPAQRRVVRMRFKKGFTFKRDNQVSIPTSEDVWLESTAVPEEQMTYCQVIAVPYKPNKVIAQLRTQYGYNGSSYFKDWNSSTAENITWIQNMNEVYNANEVDSKRVPIPGVSCIVRKKNYFCLDKDIAV
nr:MAG: putative capsid protein [Arizlama virus]